MEHAALNRSMSILSSCDDRKYFCKHFPFLQKRLLAALQAAQLQFRHSVYVRYNARRLPEQTEVAKSSEPVT